MTHMEATTTTTKGHFGAHRFADTHDKFRPCQIAGCPVVREGRWTTEKARTA